MEYAAATLTVLLGLLGLVSPGTAMRLVGIEPNRPHGLLDVRATYGGLLIALGAFPLLAAEPVALRNNPRLVLGSRTKGISDAS